MEIFNFDRSWVNQALLLLCGVAERSKCPEFKIGDEVFGPIRGEELRSTGLWERSKRGDTARWFTNGEYGRVGTGEWVLVDVKVVAEESKSSGILGVEGLIGRRSSLKSDMAAGENGRWISESQLLVGAGVGRLWLQSAMAMDSKDRNWPRSWLIWDDESIRQSSTRAKTCSLWFKQRNQFLTWEISWSLLFTCCISTKKWRQTTVALYDISTWQAC